LHVQRRVEVQCSDTKVIIVEEVGCAVIEGVDGAGVGNGMELVSIAVDLSGMLRIELVVIRNLRVQQGH